jgi:biopolymer transport protein ExbD
MLNVRWKEAQKKAEFVFDDRVYPQAPAMVDAIKTAKLTGEKKITAGANPTFRAVIRGDRNVPALYVSQAMNACAEAGITDISFSATNKE